MTKQTLPERNRHPLSVFIGTALCALSLHSTPAFSEVIQIPIAAQGAELQTAARPKTGSSRQQVIERFGQPQNSTPAVGQPPITRWDYTDFIVFFEYDHVIHSVLKHRPKNLPQ